MKISAINNVNNQLQFNKMTNVSKKANTYAENNTVNKDSQGIYGKVQVGMNQNYNPSFKGLGLAVTLLQCMGLVTAYGITSFAVLVIGDYIADLNDKHRESVQKKMAAERLNKISEISKNLHVTEEEAAKYHDEFLSIAAIKPENNGHEIGLNAIQGYGLEKYKLAMDFIAPVINRAHGNEFPMMPNGLLLYGPPGSGKTYAAEKTCEHLKHFGINVIEVKLKEKGHAKNAETIKTAFKDAEEYYNMTSNPSVIYFPQDIDNYFIDRNKNASCVQEVRALLNCAENCASKGITWIGTANYPKMIDSALLRPGRLSLKIPIGNMEDFEIGDMIKYVLYGIDEKDSAQEFDYKKVTDVLKQDETCYTPDEIRLFVENAKLHNPHPEEFVTADMVIDEINTYKSLYNPTLTPESVAKFKEDQSYIRNLDNEELSAVKTKKDKAAARIKEVSEKAKAANKVAAEAKKEAQKINKELNKAKKEEQRAKTEQENIEKYMN